MSVHPDDDAPRPVGGDGFSDAVTLAFGDPSGSVCGVARLGVADGRASGLAVVFRDGAPVAVSADANETAGVRAWGDVRVAGLCAETLEPLVRWHVRFEGAEALDLTFEATSGPLELAADADAARAGGMAGFDQVCRVHGTVGATPFEGLGQRGRSWGVPDWERMRLARTVSAWLDTEHAVSLVAVRPVDAAEHGGEAITAFVFDADRVESPVLEVADPRLSTAYDGDGRQRRAGLELYVDEDDEYARRAAGEVVAGTSLDLGRLRLDCAFFRWRMEGRSGIGRYDVLRRT